MELIETWTREHAGQQCEALLMAGGVPCARYRTVAEAMADPQTRARGALTRIKDESGEYWVPNAPFQMPGLSTAPHPHVPHLGESTVDILVELLGYSTDQAAACVSTSGTRTGSTHAGT